MSREFAHEQQPNQALLADTSRKLRARGIGFGIYGGYHAVLLAGHRRTPDADIWVDEMRFGDLREVFPEASVRQRPRESRNPESFAMELGDGTVSVMGAAVLRLDGLAYPADFEAVRGRIRHQELHGVESNFVDPVDTVIAKAITQRDRSQGKHDIADIRAIRDAVELDTDYLVRRIAGTPTAQRVTPLLSRLGILSAADTQKAKASYL